MAKEKGIAEDVTDAFVGECTAGDWCCAHGVVLSLGIAGLQVPK